MTVISHCDVRFAYQYDKETSDLPHLSYAGVHVKIAEIKLTTTDQFRLELVREFLVIPLHVNRSAF